MAAFERVPGTNTNFGASMELNISNNPNDVIKSRPAGEARVKQPVPSSSVPEADHFDYKKDPVYQSQKPASGSFSGSSPNLGDSYEGFKSSANDAGMPNLGKTDGFGAQFEMPEPGANEQFMGSQYLKRDQVSERKESFTMPETFVDLQTSLHAMEEIVKRLRENLMSPEQAELESLLRQGSQLIQSNFKQLSGVATQQVSGLKEDLKENPYRGLIGALKIGMAISQIISTRHVAASAAPLAGDNEDRVTH